MGLSIKDEELLREKYAKIEKKRQKASIEELLAIADETSALLDRPYLSHELLLYDMDGIPK